VSVNGWVQFNGFGGFPEVLQRGAICDGEVWHGIGVLAAVWRVIGKAMAHRGGERAEWLDGSGGYDVVFGRVEWFATRPTPRQGQDVFEGRSPQPPLAATPRSRRSRLAAQLQYSRMHAPLPVKEGDGHSAAGSHVRAATT
jgi:hypothetical protein